MTLTDITLPAGAIGGLLLSIIGLRIQHHKDKKIATESAEANAVALFNALNVALQTEIDKLRSEVDKVRQEATNLRNLVMQCEEKHGQSIAEQERLRLRIMDLEKGTLPK